MKIKKALIPTALALGVLLTSCGDKKCDSHDYGDWSTIKAPTCKEEGSKERVCKNCGEKETDTIAKLTTHTYGDWSTDNEPGCDTTGSKVKNQYTLQNYDTLNCGNLYAYVIERSFKIENKNGKMGMIVPTYI